jgi:ABC-type transport system involved in cytochrome bd biosynthesis fused ATPase/permease subunit
MVARALATGASTLLLDEPTAGVDADSELRMADALADLHAEGRTIVLVTHDLMLAARCDRQLKLDLGRIQGGRGPDLRVGTRILSRQCRRGQGAGGGP